jgi:hypothetical protein
VGHYGVGTFQTNIDNQGSSLPRTGSSGGLHQGSQDATWDVLDPAGISAIIDSLAGELMITTLTYEEIEYSLMIFLLEVL